MTTHHISRRSLGKSLMFTGAAAAVPSALQADTPQSHAAVSSMPQLAHAKWTEVHPGVWRARIGSPESYTPVSSRLIPVQEQAFSHLPPLSDIPLPAPEGYISQRGVTVELPLRPNELVYGLGLQFLSFAQRGKKKIARVNADPKVDSGDSHAPVPFYVTTQGVGILVDSARYVGFYFGDARPAPEKPENSAANKNPDPNYTHNIRDSDHGKVTIEVPRADGVDIYLFAGPTMLDAVRRYNVFSGGGVEAPEWGLGFWYRADARTNTQEALSLAKEFRQRNIPCDVFGLEPGWQSHAYSCTFAWDSERFPDPAAFLNSARDLNYRVNLWEHAFTHPASPIFADLRSSAGSYGVWGGLVPDFAGDRARRVFGEYHGKTFVEKGVSGFKLDECDNSDFTGGWSFPELSHFPSGIDGEQMHSIFGLRYQHTIWEQYRKRNLKTYGLVRSSGALAAPYPFVLYSDLYDHRQFIRALVNSGFSGLLWCPEVRDAVSEEDLFRRLQSVVFSPLAIVNGWYIKSPPWRQLNRKLNNAGETMSDWEQVEARCKEIIGWRMSLIPYLRAAFQRYAMDGTPPFRALVLDHPADPALSTVDDQYMVGDRMMVAPMFAGEPQRKVVLPAGTDWHDFWTGQVVHGGSTIMVDRSTPHIPVYVKTGSILPWAEVSPHTGTVESRHLTARVYGNGSLEFTLPGQPGAALRWSGNAGTLSGATDYVVKQWQVID